jgi:hypothetical protein
MTPDMTLDQVDELVLFVAAVYVVCLLINLFTSKD